MPVSDLERSTSFYRDTLGLEQTGEGAWPEFRLGENVFLYLLDPTNIGQEFRGPHSAPIAMRVSDVEEARSALEAKGIAFHGETFDTGVCQMAHFSIRTATSSCSTGGTRPVIDVERIDYVRIPVTRILLHHRYAPYPDETTP